MRYSLCYDIENFLSKVLGKGFNQVTERYLHRLFDETKVVPRTLQLIRVYTEEGEKFVFSANYDGNGRVDVWINKDNFDIIKEVNIFTGEDLVSIKRNYFARKDEIESDFNLIVSYYDKKTCDLVADRIGKIGELPRVASVEEFESEFVHDAITSYNISEEASIRDVTAIPNAERLIEQMRKLNEEQNKGKEPETEKVGYSSNLDILFKKSKGM